ncbi:fungal-specific transcription factor domain-containing protein [Aspergillus carlsbadensis]|nr:fungal-specific transcription factor domain-containing protein [Aspergillus carlsbadensis]
MTRHLTMLIESCCTLTHKSLSDRCRKKKIKCDGDLPGCRNCTRAGKPCEASVPLQRNTRVRGFVTDDKHVQGLQSQLLECQRALQAERETSSLLRQQLARQENQPVSAGSIPVAANAHHGDHSALLHLPSALGGPKLVSDDSSHIIKHMGRLVHDATGVSRFAGSTTGVHFILTVEDTCKQTLYLTESFPDSCYSLYLAGPAVEVNKAPSSVTPGGDDLLWNLASREILDHLRHPIEFYTDQIDEFLSRWEAFCPVLARKQLLHTVREMVQGIQVRAGVDGADSSTLCILLSIMSINHLAQPIHDQLDHDIGQLGRPTSIFDRLQSHLTARGDIHSLQGLVLLSFYYQLTGQSLGLIKLNGSMARIAQSLGLHRHARRFRMNVGEIELRKRIWWWVYIFDRITAIVHGLPPLISDADVDNELPTDCHIDDFAATELHHPLPGQTTPVSFFNHYATLSKKMSSILGLLYTTTQRRQGVAKIERLDRDIRAWSQNLGLEEEALEPATQPYATANGRGALLAYLRLLSRFGIILVHRPGLTFDDSTSEFADCLGACVRASTELIHLLMLPDLEHSLLSFCPIGPGLVFQCALMQIFCQCKSRTLLTLPGLPTLHESTDLISRSITLLEKYHRDPRTVTAGESSHEDYETRSIGSAIALLRKLTLLLQPDSSQFLSWHTGPVVFGTPYSFSSSSLNDLNYMTAMDWAQDISDTFGHMPDLGG